MMPKRTPAPIRALREEALVDERPRADLRGYVLAFFLGLVLGATVVCTYFWWRIASIADEMQRPSWSTPVYHNGDE